jgi:S-formylglutathione hydrolase FrmB
MTEPTTAPGQLRGRLRARAPWLIGLVVAAVAVALFYLSGTAAGTDDTLQIMGFDPDRAHLLTALIATAMAAAIVALAGAPTALGVIAGLVAGGLGFGHTALLETRAALAAHGTQGTFDPLGWVVSVVTFAVAFAVAGWAAAILAREVRQRVVAAAVTIRDLVRGRDRRRARTRLAAATGVLLSVAVVVAALPVFGDMLNFDPDVHMRQDAAGVPGLLNPATGSGTSILPGGSSGSVPGGSTDVTAGAGTDAPAASPSYPPGLVAGPLPSSLVTPGAVSVARPWSATLPSGHSRVTTVSLPGPWTGGTLDTIAIDVYLPPGYDAGSARYPVIYALPHSIATWDHGMRLTGVLDALITSGSIPPTIMVFANQFGGPYPDSQCADSVDGREWFDRFVATDLVSWVDAHFRTIATSASRATLGFSGGGYCSAALLAHHPDVFGSSIVLSGYFVAGIHSGTTPNAWRPFSDSPAVADANPAVVDAVSPMTVIPRIPAPLRAGLFVVMAADPTQGFYGPQMEKFAAVLHAAGVALAIIPTPLGHSWAAATQLLPTMLEMVAGRMVTLGVFGPGL